MELKSTAAQFNVELGTSEFEGYAAAFNNIDSDRDRLSPGAFTKTLSERFSTDPKQNKIKVLAQHDYRDPIGYPRIMELDTFGLRVRAKLANTSRAQELLELIKSDVIQDLSIGYSAILTSVDILPDQPPIRHLKEVKLYEFSPVVFPANELARISSAKFGQESEPLELLLERVNYLLPFASKSGRVLSTTNITRVKTAIEHLQALLNDAEPPEETPKSDTSIYSGAAKLQMLALRSKILRETSQGARY